MIAKDWNRAGIKFAVGLGILGWLGPVGFANAQQPKAGPGQPSAAKGKPPAINQPAAAKPTDQPPAHVEMKLVPVNPNDPVAIVNGEVVTRQQLADECVSRKGEEILDTLIARRILEQALRANKLQVTEAEIYAEIDRIAANVAGTSREKWLQTLAKEKKISPAQYSRDVIYPSLALRKLAEPRVQITEQDIQDAFDAQFGEQLVYRMIMCRSPEHAKQVWEEIRKNPAGFEHIAMNDDRSIDPATKATGGKPINGYLQRHSFPREVTDRIFRELVDGDPADKDPEHKPKDGQISGALQVSEDAWLIVKREAVIPARPYDKNDQALVQEMRAAITESKVQAEMEAVFDTILASAAIENKLTGVIKQRQAEISNVQVDPNVKLMSQPPVTAPPPQTDASGVPAPTALPDLPPPAGVSEKERQALEKARVNPPKK